MTEPNTDIRLRQFAAACCAFRFLTVLPVSWQADRDGELFPQCVIYFPLVGLIIGGFGTVICSLLGTFFPPSVVSFVAVLYLSAISGFLHLDGLADSGDGLLSHRSRERSLDIMKDSRIGAMGVVVILLVMLGKFSALSALSPAQILVALFLMPIAGRVAIVFSMALFRYAREGGGLGGLFYSSKMTLPALSATLLLVGCGWAVGEIRLAGLVFCTTIACAFIFGSFCKTRIGGVTGDTLGAACELNELTTALVVCALYY